MSADDDGARRSLKIPHRVYHNVLTEDVHAALLAWAIANEAQFKLSKVNGGPTGLVDPSRRISMRARDFGPSMPVVRQRIVDLAPSLIHDLRVTAFVPTDIELELIASNDGAFFARHVDTVTDKMSRKRAERLVSAVYYFNAEPKGFSGGALRLYPLFEKPGETSYVDIQPEPNTLVAFPSWMPHEVLPIGCATRRFADSRFSVNVWLRRNATPVAS